MKILIDIPDGKAEFILELLKHLTYVKVKILKPSESHILTNLKTAVDEVNEIKAGNKKGKPLKEFLDEI